MPLIIFDVYGTLISTGTGSLDAVKKILALQEEDIKPEEFYREWKQQHRINMDNANTKVFVNETCHLPMPHNKKLFQNYP